MKKLPFPSLVLSEWKETRNTLHKYCRLVGAIRETLSLPLPHSQHTNLLLYRNGFTTSTIQKNVTSPDHTFEVIIDLIYKKIRIESNYREPLYVALTGQSLNALCDETCSLLVDIGIKPPLERPSFLEGTRGRFDIEYVKAYWRAVKSTKKILKQFKSALDEKTSPIQLHVDTMNLSLTWYCKGFFKDTAIEELEFGLSTGDDAFPEAYYFIDSFPDNYALKKIVSKENGLHIIFDNYKMILPYSKIVETTKAEMILLDFFSTLLKRF